MAGGRVDSPAPVMGCVGCLALIAIVVVDIVPFLILQPILATGRHALWADGLILLLGLLGGPAVAALVGYLGFRYRERMLAVIEARWPETVTRETAAALNVSEATFAVALGLALAAGAVLGSAVIAVLDGLLP